MSTSEKIILTVLVVFAVLVWLVPLAAAIYLEKQEQKKRGEPDPEKAEFDERQRLIRLEASRHALYALGGYLLVWLVLEFLEVLPWAGRTVALLGVGLMLAVLVWSGECILRGALLGFNQWKNESGTLVAYCTMGACWTVAGCANLAAKSSSLAAIQLSMGTCYLAMGGLMLCARRRRRRADAEDGEA